MMLQSSKCGEEIVICGLYKGDGLFGFMQYKVHSQLKENTK